MNIENYFISVTKELESLKNRVRDFIDDAHWQTDGEWKESVLRTILKRHIPSSFKIGRGFVINREEVSKQIDILIYDSSKPILYQDGNLVFITPDSAKIIIEVKTRLTYHSLGETLDNICSNAEIIRAYGGNARYFGLFSYENDMADINRILGIIKDKVGGHQRRVIKYLSLGNSNFIRYWHNTPGNDNTLHQKWHAYNLVDKAPAYFINNIVGDVCRSSVALNQNLWYPGTGKEPFKVGEIELRNL